MATGFGYQPNKQKDLLTGGMPTVANMAKSAMATPTPPAQPASAQPFPQQNDGVADNVAKITASDSPLMKQAEQRGFQVANRRGLLNSSIAAGASQAAVLDAATPIATQDASQNFQKNLATQNFQQNRVLQSDADTSATARTAMQIGSSEKIAQLNDATQRFTTGLNVQAAEKANAASLANAFTQTYSQMFGEIAKNADLPKETREQYLTHIMNVSNSNFSLMQGLYGVDFKYGGGTTPASNGTAAPVASGGLLQPPSSANAQAIDSLKSLLAKTPATLATKTGNGKGAQTISSPNPQYKALQDEIRRLGGAA
jgi:hypothetical protein